MNSPHYPAPVAETERFRSLDAVRGFALLGILLMNILGMAMHETSYYDPISAGGAVRANLAVWTVLQVLAEGKMRCLFSMVFGGGIILLTSRLEARGQSADIYYRRTLWLLAFGIAHAYLLWSGDILYPYAVCALLLYPFRELSARRLIAIGALVIVANAGIYVSKAFKTSEMVRDGRAAIAASRASQQLSEKQKDAKSDYEDFLKYNRPTREDLEEWAKGWRGSVMDVLKARAEDVTNSHSEAIYSPDSVNWDVWCMMFVGMGLMKLGVMNGERPARFYARLAIVSYAIGIPLNAAMAWLIIRSRFDPGTMAFTNGTYDVGRLAVALGHMGAVIWIVKSDVLRWLSSSLRAVGQMALTNYIFQSVVAAFIFTGYGLKLYERLERYQLYYIVAAIWVVQMIASPLWLRYYRFGPLEWCWRSLTYWKRQPMRRTEVALSSPEHAAA